MSPQQSTGLVGRLGVALLVWIEEIVDPAFENLGQAESERQRWIEPSAFNGDDRLTGHSELVGEALL